LFKVVFNCLIRVLGLQKKCGVLSVNTLYNKLQAAGDIVWL
jgi:hypothetical protein